MYLLNSLLEFGILKNSQLAQRILLLLGAIIGATAITTVLSVEAAISHKPGMTALFPLGFTVLSFIAAFIYKGFAAMAATETKFNQNAHAIMDTLNILVIGGNGMTNEQRRQVLRYAQAMVGNHYNSHPLRGELELWGQNFMHNHDIYALNHDETVSAKAEFERIMREGGIPL